MNEATKTLRAKKNGRE